MKTFKSWNDIEIAYQEWGGASTPAPPVVLHHGFVADANTNWVIPGVVDALVAAGRTVVAPDARGLVLAGDADSLAVRPEMLAEAIPEATLRMVSGDHMAAIADPRFTTSIVDFLA
jgi:pimeloyl-ACP methyl ester carboxylesterase